MGAKDRIREGKYTAESLAEELGLKRQSALNLLSRLKKKGLARASGGGRQKRIYTIRKLPWRNTNGFYDVVNKYSPEKLRPRFEHYVTGNYTVERAIIDGIRIGDARTMEATKHLFRHVRSWKRLFGLAKREKLEKKVIGLYESARKTVKCGKIPARYAE
ncbi:MAG: hypothetical protein WC602_03910 [archaeon]